MNKKGQVTIFVILAMIIVVGGLVIYTLVGSPKSSSLGADENPEYFIQNCLEDDFLDLVDIISTQGGSLDPEFYFEYYGNKIGYLCYETKPFELCSVQKPFLKEHIERELEFGIEDKVTSCFDSLEETLTQKGYTLNLKRGLYEVKLTPNEILLEMNYSLSSTKGDTKIYEPFLMSVESKLYELVGVSKSIVEWESFVGDTDVTEFMSIYHNLNIRKLLGSDERKVYIVTDKETDESFTFASRSMAFPPGMI